MKLIPDEQWTVYHDAISAVRRLGLPFTLGGGFALAAYTGRWRNTKDIDFYILPGQRVQFVDVLSQAGFRDYFPQLAYDRGWIYRGFRDGAIVDLIWSMANRRANVEKAWFEHSQELKIRDESIRLIAAEELLWCKMYVLQRDHSDWPDVLNLLYATGPALNWGRLLDNVGEDMPVLRALLTLFAWICPARAAELPADLKRRLKLHPLPLVSKPEERRRIQLLDSRNWFAAHQPIEKPLEV
ncbi:MAG: nucleotidyltransferase family protein [Verrucomicrobia subdivision 3 bacterium]|nr:nucleotidyltransferase family protein [Limisphaerales bacterium]